MGKPKAKNTAPLRPFAVKSKKKAHNKTKGCSRELLDRTFDAVQDYIYCKKTVAQSHAGPGGAVATVPKEPYRGATEGALIESIAGFDSLDLHPNTVVTK